MKSQRVTFAVKSVLLLTAASASAQQPPLPPPVTPNPNYFTMSFSVNVNRSARAVWARVGKFCDIGEWARYTCVLSGAADGQVGAVRYLNDRVTEILVAKTDLSYTYAQPARVGVPYNLYHGTLEAKPVTASTSELIYTFFYDTSMIASEARPTEAADRRSRFMGYLQNMKTLAEGGQLPPATH